MQYGDLFIELVADPKWVHDPAEIWFEVEVQEGGWAVMRVGVDNGDRPCTQTTTLELSDVFDPFPAFAELAEAAVTGGLPTSFELDSEGPMSVISMRAISDDGLAYFLIHDAFEPVIHFAALVDARQCGLALALSLKTSLFSADLQSCWKSWKSWFWHTRDDSEYNDWRAHCFGSKWLRDLPLDETAAREHQ